MRPTRQRGVTCAAVLCTAVVAGCSQQDPSTDSPVLETVCPEAEERLGKRVCVHAVPDTEIWESLTVSATPIDQVRTTTYMVPAREDARLPTVFVDATVLPEGAPSSHFAFLTASFPEFETLEYDEYVELVMDPELREWFSGSVTEYIIEGGDVLYGFGAYDGPATPLEATITCQQFTQIHATLDDRFGPEPFVVVPLTDFQRDVLADCDLPQHDPSTALDYEPYTKKRGCGTVRRYTLPELALAETNAEFGWQDVLVVDQAPLDIETVISGIVTGTRQGELSHLNVRSAARGTPNCYVKDAYELMAEWEGELVELYCGPTRAEVVAITPEAAQECWDAMRPDPVEVVPPDRDFTELVGLLELPTETAEERRSGVGRFGSKGANLATLYQRIDPELQLQGFLIPFFYYESFVTTNEWSVDLGNGLETLTFAETIDRYLDDETFLSDGALRRQRLMMLENAMQAAPCDPDFIAALDAEIVATFGGDDVMVRFRSSSNAEDSLTFNGAGLYDSTSACLADENDADALGPSHCDPDQPAERDLCRAMNRVWASLWKMKAFEEREWYGIDHRQVVMGILVNTRTKDELANVVAFSGNPLLAGDDSYLINAQVGELDVVASQPGVWPEKDLLTMENGVVTEIERARGSTELPEGEWVLDEARLEELGAALWTIVEVYPVDAEVPPTIDILLDTEWKLRSDGRLAVKQVRPFAD